MKPVRYSYAGTPLNKVLRELRITTRKVGVLGNRRELIHPDGDVLFTGTVHEVWEWLKKTGRAEPYPYAEE